MIKFGDAKGDNKGNDILNENIEELEDEDDNDLYTRKNSQDFTKNTPTYNRLRKSILKNINLENNIVK